MQHDPLCKTEKFPVRIQAIENVVFQSAYDTGSIL